VVAESILIDALSHPNRHATVDDPPTFESQATYLDRHVLLTASEQKQLTRAPFEPEPPALAG
jgi:hypothetical protein